MNVTFVTSNEYKFKHAQHIVETFGVTLSRTHMDLEELQSESGEEITRHKAQQAYDKFKHPLVVNDDCWSIPGLNGFPGAYMKSMNHWFKPDDWLHLTQSLTDRRMILQQNLVYQDESGQHYFVHELEGLILPEVRGTEGFSHLTVLSFDGGKTSSSERISLGMPAVDNDKQTGWHLFAEWLTKQ